ncbi:hypothetical protein DSCO28_38460 [Desulfosarcina ovata subsp. sediminis]|uniref:Uncharacterized protein n=1 Tax=Desulfosarcina ovata subsp. sediminis TaxID=885957 RepID=A0A5K7ZSU7_9BACT|nr:hypothetical protein [Desulfosarcina ovata]BBO83280.1 hypothetical protein DSCO28_38460 [Desulfosarcina ovata subsp. sediminis]
MKSRNKNQKALNILTTATKVFLDKSQNMKSHQDKIDDLLKKACDLDSRQEILNIMYKSKQIELMEKLEHLQNILNDREKIDPQMNYES